MLNTKGFRRMARKFFFSQLNRRFCCKMLILRLGMSKLLITLHFRKKAEQKNDIGVIKKISRLLKSNFEDRVCKI